MKSYLVRLLLSVFIISCIATAAEAMDKKAFKAMAKDTIRQTLSGNIGDIDKLIATQNKLFAIGVQACKDHAKASPKDAKLMNLVVKNAEKMKAMNLEEIEEAWHEGGVLEENGIDFDDIDQFSAAGSYMDTVVHPATTYIALKEYKKTGDEELLEQVKDELSELLKHLEHAK